MRLQVMHLPAPPDEYPFLLIIDGASTTSESTLADGLAEMVGARAVLVFADEVEVL